MRTDLFDYALPPELIAQTPLSRGESRLLVLHRASGDIEHRRFSDVLDYLHPGDTLVLNNTRVTARRLRALRPSGQEAEVLLLRSVGERFWEALVRPGKSLRPGKTVTLLGSDGAQVEATISGTTEEGGRLLELATPEKRDLLQTWGEIPLPPYIQTPLPHENEERYQTVYAEEGGSAAAPTAGLHFTPELLQRADAQGVRLAYLTLHVGVGTFRPVRTENVDEHVMHHEIFRIPPETAEIVNATPGRVIAVGTTSVRSLETVAAHVEKETGQISPDGRASIRPYLGETNLFITPGYRFRRVEGLITNFHLPKSTLLMLVSAFSTRERVLRAYAEAVERGYRFFSFGDAMLLL